MGTMVARVVRLLRNFPHLFQPINYSIRKRLTKKRNKENRADIENEDDANCPTLQLPQISRSKSSALYINNSKNIPTIRIRRATTLKANNHHETLKKKLSLSESNLAYQSSMKKKGEGNGKKDKSLKLKREKSVSIANNLNNNSINVRDLNGELELELERKLRKSKSKNVPEPLDVPTIPRAVAKFGGDASQKSSTANVVGRDRQMVRVINGADPSVQSQILLNTRTPQPWESLVRDLAVTIKLPNSKRIGNRLETLYGRQVKSYSHLRSELKVGNNTFYIYTDMDDEDENDDLYSMQLPNLQRHRLSMTPEDPLGYPHQSNRVRRSASNASARRSQSRSRSPSPLPKLPLAKTLSNSSGELTTVFSSTRYLDLPSDKNLQRRRRRRSQTNSPKQSALKLPQIEDADKKQERFRRSSSPTYRNNYYKDKIPTISYASH